MHRLFGALFIVGLALAGCSNEPQGAEYFGDRRTERKVYDVKMLVPFTGEVTGVAITSNRGTVEIGGHKYYITVTVFDGLPGMEADTSYTRLDNDGIYSRKSTDPAASETLELAFPPTVGKKWTSVEDEIRLESEVVEIHDFETLDKTYKRCLKVAHSGTRAGLPVEGTTHYAPNVGMVQISMRGGGVALEMKLRAE